VFLSLTGHAEPSGLEDPAGISQTTVKPDQSAGAESRTANEAISDVPGVFATQRGTFGLGIGPGGAGTLSIRGSSTGQRSVFLIDGRPNEMGLFGHALNDSYGTENVERIEVVRGPDSVRYGSGALAGSINLIPKRLYEDGMKSSLSLSGGSFGSRSAVLENGRRGEVWDTYATASNKHADGDRDGSKADSSHGSLLVGRQMGGGWETLAAFRHSDDYAQDPGSLSEVAARHAAGLSVDKWSRMQRSAADVTVRNNQGDWRSSFKTFVDYGHNVIRQHSSMTYLWDSIDRVFGGAFNLTHPLSDKTEWVAGGDFKAAGGDGTDSGLRTHYETRYMDEGGVFGMAKGEVLPRLTASAGLRSHWHQRYGQSFIPQSGLEYGLPFDVKVKASVAKGFRSPTIAELYNSSTANKDLKPEQGWNYETGFSQSGTRGGWDVTGYILKGKELIRADGVAPALTYRNTGRFTHKGIEASAHFMAGRRWKFTGGAALMDPRNETKANPRQRFTATAAYLWKKAELAYSVEKVEKLYGADFRGQRLPNFTTSKLDADARVTDSVRVFATVGNLFNESYQLQTGYPMPKRYAEAGVRLSF
jgi:iron complex outermembrane receptor protein